MPKRDTGFAERLREVRQAKGLTQEQLAERAGLHKMAVAKLEQGTREPAWATVLTLAEALGVPVTEFVPPAAKRKGKG